MIWLKIHLIFAAFVIFAAIMLIIISLIKNRNKPNSENVFKVIYNSFTDIKNYDDIDAIPKEELENAKKEGKKELSIFLVIVLLIFSLIPIYNVSFLKSVYNCCFFEKEELEKAVEIIEKTNKDD